MAKISPVSGKYIVHASIRIDGLVDRPDVIGAIFGQTEGLLGSDLELRELQRSGRIGRIEVLTDGKGGKTQGTITIPSSLDKAETAIIAAALEVIDRIGPCAADIRVKGIEDIRISKRTHVIDRAKELLSSIMDSQMPDSQEIAEEVAESVRVMEITSWGSERLPAGPAVEDSEDIIVVEGRADVLTLLRHGFKNAISMNGANAPKSLLELCKEKTVTVFVDGDRGGDLNIKELAARTEIDFVCRAPDGKEVEELTKKEIHKALRSKVSAEQGLADVSHREKSPSSSAPRSRGRSDNTDRNDTRGRGRGRTREDRDTRGSDRAERSERAPRTEVKLSVADKKKLTEYLESLVGTHGAFVLNNKLDVLGKVPRTELESTLNSIDRGSVHTVVVDGTVDQGLLDIAKTSQVQCVAGTDSNVRRRLGIKVVTGEQLA